ncbi:uncharacterized protein LOC120431572 isoform X1 [Culex pipiens pallens]|uniref:uncharacterized protein LOC120431572 isoform X1 n=1 Tax=Culex pipiens pallens TaxID=42434 RepID=UPI001954C097|nr:uncharacterized protein LOC120431572 isoform X1 [Culex pipiens pallens]
MADEAAVEFLRKYNLERLAECFAKVGANRDHFRYLRNNLVELMLILPVLDDRAKFVEAFDSEEASASDAIEAPSPSAPLTVRANLETICQMNDEGKKFWRQAQVKFGKPEREMLAPIITAYFYKIASGSINQQMFNEMFEIIRSQFPSETNKHIWYVGGNHPQGFLYESYRRLQTKAKQTGNKNQKKKKVANVLKHDARKTEANKTWHDLSEEEKDACSSAKLMLSTIPYNEIAEIFESWDASYPIRRFEIMSGNFKIEDYNVLNNFTKAHDLITKDFTRLHGKMSNIAAKIPVFVKKFNKIFHDYRKLIKDDTELCDEIIKTFSHDPPVNDHSIFLVFYTLPLLLRENFVYRGGKRMRPTLFMSRNAYMTIIPTEATLTETIETTRKKAQDRQTTVQPFIVAVGSIENIKKYFVVFDDLLLPCSRAIEAVDIHYKLHDVFNLLYAAECQTVLHFTQKFFYGQQYEEDSIRPHVEELISDILNP